MPSRGKHACRPVGIRDTNPRDLGIQIGRSRFFGNDGTGSLAYCRRDKIRPVHPGSRYGNIACSRLNLAAVHFNA